MDLAKEQSLRLKVLSCDLRLLNCITDAGQQDEYLLGLDFITIFNDRHYNPEEYDPSRIVVEKAVVKRHTVNFASPQTDIYNLKLNKVTTQDDVARLLPLNLPEYDLVTTHLYQTVTESP